MVTWRSVGASGLVAFFLGLFTLSVALGEPADAPPAQAPLDPVRTLTPTPTASSIPTPPAAPVSVAAPTLHELEGLVSDANGLPLWDTAVDLRCAGSTIASTHADEDGYFFLSGMGMDPCSVDAQLENYIRSSVDPGDRSVVDVFLARAPGLLSIVALDAYTGVPAKDALVTVAAAADGVVVEEGRIDANGRLSYWLEPRNYRVRIDAAGYATRGATALISSNVDVPITFPMSMAMQGTVRSRDTGNPIQNAWVTVYRLGPPDDVGTGMSRRLLAETFGGADVVLPDLPPEIDDEMIGYTLTDRAGGFWFEAPYDGEYRVVAEAPGWNPWPESTDVGILTEDEPLLDFRLAMSRLVRRVPVTPPIRIDIPALAAGALVLPVGVERDGTMEAPSDPDTVVWYQYGAGVGRPGNAILAGHVNWAGRLRTFGRLNELHAGDVINLTAASGERITYRVEWSTLVAAQTEVTDIIRQGPREEITLITCGGEFDTRIRDYRGRLIVRAVRDG